MALLKPATTGALVILRPHGSNVSGKIGSSTGATSDFVLKLWASIEDYGSPDEETTGDGDAYPFFENNGLLYGDTVYIGGMMDNAALGLQNIVTAAKNPTAAAVAHVISNTRENLGTYLIRHVRRHWKKTGVYVPVQIICRLHNTNPATLEGTVT